MFTELYFQLFLKDKFVGYERHVDIYNQGEISISHRGVKCPLWCDIRDKHTSWIPIKHDSKQIFICK